MKKRNLGEPVFLVKLFTTITKAFDQNIKSQKGCNDTNC